MSNAKIQLRSTLETFPDELFFELFEYIPIYDLHRAFFGLNQRFNLILRSLSNLFAEWTINSNDRAIDRFASGISRLVIWRGGYLRLNRFTKLRSLKLVLPTVEQCNEIRASSTLEHLHIESLVSMTTITDLVCTLFLTNAFPRLRTCRMDEIKLPDENYEQLPTLRSLITRTQSPAKLLLLCPMLIHLRLNLKENIEETFPSDDFHVNLRHLELGIYSSDITLATIKIILSLLPNVTRFRLDGPCRPPPENKLDICSLAPVLRHRLPKLRVIELSLPLNDSHLDPKESENERESLKKLHPLFNQVIFRPRSFSVPGRLLISSKTDSQMLALS